MKLDIKDLRGPESTAKIFLNGELVTDCAYANDVTGEVRVYLRDDDGDLIENNGHLVESTKKGKVKIILGPEWEYVGGQFRRAENE